MKSHLKRLAAPRTWLIKRKGVPFITRPKPSGSPMDMSLPLVVALKTLGYARTTKEVKRLLQSQEVLVDGVRVKEHDRSINLFGVLSFPLLKANFILTISRKNKLIFVSVDSSAASKRPLKIQGKTVIRGGKVQINCSGGYNLIVDNVSYKRGDTVLLDLKTRKITGHFPFDKGSLVFLNRGRHVGHTATIKDFTSHVVTLVDDEGNTFDTARKYCFVIGKKKPEFVVA